MALVMAGLSLPSLLGRMHAGQRWLAALLARFPGRQTRKAGNRQDFSNIVLPTLAEPFYIIYDVIYK
jgi:hypothetical protein